MRRIAATLAVATLLIVGVQTFAGEDAGKDKSCSKAKACCASKAADAAKGLLASLPPDVPKMRCMVGDEVRHCPMDAEKLSKETGKPIHYFLGEKEFESREQIAQAYAKELEGYLTKITAVSYGVGDQCVNCPMKAKQIAKKEGKDVEYRLASFRFDCQDMASKKAAAARKAADGVALTMTVAEKSYHCPTKAADAAKACGKPVQYKVGNQMVADENLARILLALTKIEAAVKEIEPPAKRG